ncbi:hypothetical protein DFH09DRAFT_1338622 [Mycena vulgaris]|nr:hypothetical protein DFH09DRAFT_1338622 [Mycena vulgaris]
MVWWPVSMEIQAISVCISFTAVPLPARRPSLSLDPFASFPQSPVLAASQALQGGSTYARKRAQLPRAHLPTSPPERLRSPIWMSRCAGASARPLNVARGDDAVAASRQGIDPRRVPGVDERLHAVYGCASFARDDGVALAAAAHRLLVGDDELEEDAVNDAHQDASFEHGADIRMRPRSQALTERLLPARRERWPQNAPARASSTPDSACTGECPELLAERPKDHAARARESPRTLGGIFTTRMPRTRKDGAQESALSISRSSIAVTWRLRVASMVSGVDGAPLLPVRDDGAASQAVLSTTAPDRVPVASARVGK